MLVTKHFVKLKKPLFSISLDFENQIEFLMIFILLKKVRESSFKIPKLEMDFSWIVIVLLSLTMIKQTLGKLYPSYSIKNEINPL